LARYNSESDGFFYLPDLIFEQPFAPDKENNTGDQHGINKENKRQQR